MKYRYKLFLILAVLTCFSNLTFGQADQASGRLKAADSAEQVDPLPVGALVPNGYVKTVNGESVALSMVLGDRPTVLIFYRGGWCPYCNTHLGELAKIEPDLIKLGYKIVAISPDQPTKLLMTIAKNNLKYIPFSDSKMTLIKAFGLAFKVDDETVKTYKEKYQIDLEGDSGETHHLLPVPAAFIVDSQGRIQYRYFNADYKTRIDVKELLAEAKKFADQ